jgi:hypothetical protein
LPDVVASSTISCLTGVLPLLLLLLLLQGCDGARQVCRCPSPEELDADLDLLYRWAMGVGCFHL